jgi:hypothetical protein
LSGAIPSEKGQAVARGWESKAIEEQQAARESKAPVAGPSLSAAEAAEAQQLASLRLARVRVLADLQQSCRPAHRAMLEAALADLDERLRRATRGA